MSQTGEIAGGRPLFKGRVLGFPVHLDLSFVVVMAVLGFLQFQPFDLTAFLLWLLITPFAVLVHELGHAVTARWAGAEPEIALAGLGGVTQFTPRGPLSRARSFGISVAGPLVGLAVGAVLLVGYQALDPFPWTWQWLALRIGLFTCIGWSVLNLLPILPLDGGQAMRELLPGAPEVRMRRAAGVSLVVAVLAMAAAWYVGETFIALFLAFFAANNGLLIWETRAAAAAAPPSTTSGRITLALWNGQPEEARRLLADNPTGEPVDLALHGAVLALTGDKAQGHALLEQEVMRRPDDNDPAALLALTLTLEHDWDKLFALLAGPAAGRVPPSVLTRAMQEARENGRGDVALRLAERQRTGR